MHEQPGNPRPVFEMSVFLEKFKKPQYALPAAIVLGMLAIAFGVQPSGKTSAKDISTAPIVRSEPTATPSATATIAASQTVKANPSPTVASAAQANQPGALGNANTATSDVAGARSTPDAASPTVDPALQRQPTQCGAIKETTMALAVEQSISGVSIKATRAAVYPIEYFRCILMATGGQEAYSLASSVNKAEEQGMTHVVLVDVWVANASKQFGQVNLRTAALSLAGQTFPPLATLGGRSEVVISSGQGRTLSLVVAVKNTVGETTGPMTLVVEGPLTGGSPIAGKYQLFLPTP